MDAKTARLVEIAQRRNAIKVQLEGELDIKVLEELELEVEELIDEEERLRKEILAEKNMREKEIKMENKEERAVSLYETLEYREAFRNYLTSGNPEVLKMRADEVTTTAHTSAIIPQTIVNEIIRELAAYGELLPLVTYTNYKGGVRVPISGAKPTAQWVSEGSTAEKDRQKVDDYIQFSYYKLQVKVSITLLAATVTLENWEQLVAVNIAEAMAVALETSILNGTGSGQPLGILNDLDAGSGEGRIPQSAQHDFAVADATWTGWSSKLIGNMPLAYRKEPNVILVNPATWDTYMNGMVDEHGQPVARTNYGINGEEVLRFFGKRVILSEDVTSLADATKGQVIAIYFNPKNYMINTNLGMTTKIYTDEDTDEIIRKSTMIVDGKLADVNGIVVLKKA